VYLTEENVYRCPAREKLTYRFTSEEHGQKLPRYWTNACRNCTGVHPDECHDDDGLAWCENHHPLPASFTWINDRGDGTSEKR
jgi:hypothetical protein